MLSLFFLALWYDYEECLNVFHQYSLKILLKNLCNKFTLS